MTGRFWRDGTHTKHQNKYYVFGCFYMGSFMSSSNRFMMITMYLGHFHPSTGKQFSKTVNAPRAELRVLLFIN